VNSSTDFSGLFEPAQSIYLLAHSVGRLPRTTRELVEAEFFQPWAQGEDEPWNNWLLAIDSFRDALARLLVTKRELLCPQPNLSSALTRIMGALPAATDRRTILLSEDDFPSMGFVLQQAQRLGYQLRFIPAGADIGDMSVWWDQLTEEVGLVFVTHVQSNSGKRAPLTELLPVLRERGVTSIVDVAQSAGVIPIDLSQWQADFVIGSCVKWLCGGPGAGFLWASEEILPHCRPLDVGWFSHESPFEFDIHDFRYHPTALRFWGGTPSVLPCVAATAGITVITDVGVERVQRHNAGLREQLNQALAPGELLSPAGQDAAGGTAVIQCGERQGKVIAQLRSAGVAFDARATGIRLSPHIYNTPEEIAAVSRLLRPHN
jgi:kynureninase